jgi:hypothetical protein
MLCYTEPLVKTLQNSGYTRFRVKVLGLMKENARNGIEVTPETGECHWGGEVMDHEMAVGCMLQME